MCVYVSEKYAEDYFLRLEHRTTLFSYFIWMDFVNSSALLVNAAKRGKQQIPQAPQKHSFIYAVFALQLEGY